MSLLLQSYTVCASIHLLTEVFQFIYLCSEVITNQGPDVDLVFFFSVKHKPKNKHYKQNLDNATKFRCPDSGQFLSTQRPCGADYDGFVPMKETALGAEGG